MKLIDAGYISLVKGTAGHQYNKEYEIQYFVHGHGTFRIGSRVIPFRDNTLFISFPGQPHLIRVADNCPFIRLYYFRFTLPSPLPRLVTGLKKSFRNGFVVPDPNSLVILDTIKRNFDSRKTYRKESAAHLLYSFLYDVCAGYTPAAGTTTNKYILQAVTIMKNRIKDQPAEPLPMDSLAKDLGINKSYFIRLFKKHMSITPVRYLLKLKMESACFLLRSTGMHLYMIADLLGFYDEFHFSRTFKQFIGMPPKSYRESGL